MSDPVRGQRNNNPGNIRVGEHWQGLLNPEEMTPEQVAEKEFCVFRSPNWGFRAMGVIFLNYAKLHGISTIRGAISRWAPPNENDTEAYVKAVAARLGCGPDERFSLTNRQNLTGLLKAVSIHECGGWKFALGDLVWGVDAALGSK